MIYKLAVILIAGWLAFAAIGLWLVDTEEESRVVYAEPIGPEPLEIIEPPVIEEPAIAESTKDMLVRCVFAEAGNQGIEGMRLVASVILNRTDHPDFPDTVEDVIKAKGQFAVYPTAMARVTPTEEAQQAVDLELKDRTNREVLYFKTKGYHGFGTPILQHKAHYFSGR